MTEKMQHCQLVGYRDSGDYIYHEIDLPASAGPYEYIIEELRDGRLRVWNIDLAITTPDNTFYRPNDVVGLEGLRSAGFAAVPRFLEP